VWLQQPRGYRRSREAVQLRPGARPSSGGGALRPRDRPRAPERFRGGALLLPSRARERTPRGDATAADRRADADAAEDGKGGGAAAGRKVRVSAWVLAILFSGAVARHAVAAPAPGSASFGDLSATFEALAAGGTTGWGEEGYSSGG